MNTASAHSKPNRPIRWPFRALAGLVLIAGLIAVAGSAYADWTHGATSPDLRRHIALLPGALWMMHLTWHALVEGRSPTAYGWPFASNRVAVGYFIILSLVFHP